MFGSRFIKGGGVIDYPWLKLAVNRLANLFLKVLFRIRLNDTTNAFKAYRREVIEGCKPVISPHFNLTVELPLKAIVRGYSWTVIPVTWRNLAQPPIRLCQTADDRNGKPLLVHLPLCLAGKILQPRGLQETN